MLDVIPSHRGIYGICRLRGKTIGVPAPAMPEASEKTIAWLQLFVAGMLEVSWAIGLKYTDGFSKFVPSLFTGLALAGSIYLLALAARVIPIGTAYPVWVGIGALGAATLGILLFQEPVSFLRGLFIAMLVGSILGIKLTSGV